MKSYYLGFTFIILLSLSACFHKIQSQNTAFTAHKVLQQTNPSATFSTIAFGSCNKHSEAQPLWLEIEKNNPDLWIWLGDIIYGDTSDMAVMNQMYNQQLQNEAYQNIISKVPVLGVWDDHDYGVNNGGIEWRAKKESQKALLDFLNVLSNAPQRKREGIYSSYEFGSNDKKVKVILLDTRYFRDQPYTDGSILGDKQWQWLEKEIANNDAAVTLIGNGIQVIPEEHRFEKWQNFPKERQRLFDLIEKSNLANVILLSGDRHIGEVSKIEIGENKMPLYEVTSSGLTHSYDRHDGKEPNKHRLGKVVSDKNYGLIKIDWEQTPPSIELSINGLEAVTFEQYKVER